MPGSVPLPGTAHQLTAAELSRGRSLGPFEPGELDEEIEVTLLLRENPSGPPLAEVLEAAAAQHPLRRRYPGQAELASSHGCADADVERLSAWASRVGLEIGSLDSVTRRVRLLGTAGRVAAAFGVTFERWSSTLPGGSAVSFRDHRGPASIPADLSDVIEHVGGLSSRPVARSHVWIADRAKVKTTFSPEQLAAAYKFPVAPDGGAGLTLTVGIAELGGRVDQGVLGWFTRLHPRVQVTEEAVGGPLPQPDPGGADVEVALDWQVIARALLYAAPQAAIRLVVRYGANTEQGFADLWSSFATDTTHDFIGVSTSWGEAEDTWTSGGASAMDTAAQAALAQGIFHVAASGDGGATDGATDGKVYADCPASCPNVLGAGGTRLTLSGRNISSEVVWNEASAGDGATGGGVSRYFPVPTYQSGSGIHERSLSTGKTGRSEPDMVADADPVTGYEVVTGLDASGSPTTTTVGGTSAVAPLLTAGFAAISVILGAKLGRIQDPAYRLGKAGSGFRDITQGSNAYPSGSEGYSAGPGFDVPSGWGSPVFSELSAGFSAGGPAPAGG